VEGLALRTAALLSCAHAVYGITYLAALCRLLPERDPHPEVFAELSPMLDRLGERVLVAALVARFELSLLADLGFGLDLSECAATGAEAELVYVSPKSGRAVSRAAGQPWHDKLLPLPEFLRSAQSAPPPASDLAAQELTDAFALTGFFLARDVFEPRGLPLPDARAHFLAAALSPRSMGASG